MSTLEGFMLNLIQELATMGFKESLNLGFSLLGTKTQSKEVIQDFEDVTKELSSMRSFLIDMDKTEILTETMASWVEQVREAALKVENVMDEFMYCIHGQRSGASVGSKAWSRVAEQLQQIKKEIFEIPNRKDRYPVDRPEEGPSSSSSSGRRHGWQSRVEVPHESEGSYIVGTKQNEDLLLWWLTSEKAAEEPSSRIISVCGMGGLGKTTLVMRVYNNPAVKRHFDCYAWVSVSQTYQADELLRNIIKEVSGQAVPDDLDTKSRASLASMLRELLKEKRYVIVLDDVWSRNAWSDLSDVFPNTTKGNRILLTTRHYPVASLTIERRILHLKPLRDAEAWSLFCKKAFCRDSAGTDCPKDLECWARKIMGKCKGLPLGIVALGSLLSLRDRDPLHWKKFYNSMSSELINNKMLESMTWIFKLSFNDLTYRLQQCFLYCCLFPEDCVLEKSRLIRLWIAEGFVEETCGLTLEEVAEEYLTELVVRNMLQVAKKDEFGRLKACRVHDLMRELALSTTAKGENPCKIYAKQGEDIEERAHRLSIQTSIHEFKTGMNLSHLRSLLFFVNDLPSAASFSKLSSRLRLLRVLDLKGIPIERVPNAVCDLYNLRYLSLRDTRIGDLPESVGKLQRLQTLDLRNTRVKVLPRDIAKLQELRHLITDGIRGPIRKRDTFIGEPARSWIWDLKKLQTLKTIESGGKLVSQLVRLTQLRNLRIKKVCTIHGKALCDSISKMEHLLRLSISAKADQALDLKYLSESGHPPHIQKLVLHGQLESVPLWLGTLSGLVHMQLMECRLPAIENPIPLLQGLKNLMHLTLHKAYEGQQLCFPVKGFLLLKTMYLAELTWLSRVDMEKGALPNLRVLYFCRCSELKRAIEGIEYLPALQDLYLQEMPIELVRSLRGDHRLKRGIGWEAISKSLIW